MKLTDPVLEIKGKGHVVESNFPQPAVPLNSRPILVVDGRAYVCVVKRWDANDGEDDVEFIAVDDGGLSDALNRSGRFSFFDGKKLIAEGTVESFSARPVG
jgi:hypothetical protein